MKKIYIALFALQRVGQIVQYILHYLPYSL